MDQRTTKSAKLRIFFSISLIFTVAAVAITQSSGSYASEVYYYVQCQICRTPGLSGSVQDSCCDYEAVDRASTSYFRPILQELTTLSFFRYFKVNLFKSCPYWSESGMCAIRECAVCQCTADEIPKKWYQIDVSKKMMESQSKELFHSMKDTKNMKACPEQHGEGPLGKVDRQDTDVGKGWSEKDSFDIWIKQDDSEEEMTYINLLDNPERYTGYGGLSAERIWHAIYKENCFEPAFGSSLEGMCFEERVFYRLISGMQASINTHIAQEYKFRYGWGVNTQLYIDRVGNFPERLENLYFTYLFVLRSVGRAKNVLLNYDYDTGNEVEDAQTRKLIESLVEVDDNEACAADGRSVLRGFDESALFNVEKQELFYENTDMEKESKLQRKKQFREKFQNISTIMDCVGCEKCRLWGKIQIMGIGTAIKILLADKQLDSPADFERNEIIALINVLTRLSESVDAVRTFRDLEFYGAIWQLVFFLCGLSFIVLLIWIISVLLRRKRKMRKMKMKNM